MAVSREDLMRFFDENNIKTQTLDHHPMHTVSDAGDVYARVAGGHAKNLFLKDKKSNLYLLVALHDAVIDLKQIWRHMGANGRVSFGRAEQLQEVLGVMPGSVTPFALINDRIDSKVNVILDSELMKYDVLNFHPLENTATTSISREDLLKFIGLCGHQLQVLAVSQQAIDNQVD
ncbi:prolyl-tRNA synthetase associated domain-containing protein [Polycladidibacter stylochi]|uniref:prolyl-tRNA synthetase associated domain-containing protein n=1 Tax=Polycladidibacter stylochi TaxID=1807766 RepID=UPI00082DAC20|nr:prolyl-tRNA synthetase associated domain-containing protein [Pseudovibrio stylochi]